jgi:D-glycero-alpha-D-manno-heptose-7-phosphate kinase
LDRLCGEKMATPLLRCKAPLRISFAGGGTDVSPYPEQKGGAVLNCTIDKYAYATLSAKKGGTGITVHSLDYNISVDYGRYGDINFKGELDLRDPLGLVKAALRVLDRVKGASEPLDGLELFLHSDAPPGTGLGSSSTMAVALVGAFQRYLGMPWTPYEVAELAYRIEREELGIRGGRQDQYAAAFGGFNFMEFTQGTTIVTPLRISSETMNELAYRLLLCFTGTGHYSNDIIKKQQANYVEGRQDTISALDATKRIATEMKNNLLKGNVDAMGRLLNEAWELKKHFTDGISSPLIDSLYAKAREAGALGGKLVGSGGGGYLLLFCDFAQRHKVAKVVEQAGGHVVNFNFEMNGVQSWQLRP